MHRVTEELLTSLKFMTWKRGLCMYGLCHTLENAWETRTGHVFRFFEHCDNLHLMYIEIAAWAY